MNRKPPSNQIKKIIMWSGGADSTLLVKTALEKSDNFTAAKVRSHYFLSSTAEKCQERARNNFSKANPDMVDHLIDIRIHVSKQTRVIGDFYAGLGQPLMWICAILPMLPDNSRLIFGWIKGDLASKNISRIEDVFSCLCEFKGISAELSTPLLAHDKNDVFTALSRLNVGGDCWSSCDHPMSGRCGFCPKCIEYKKWKKGSNQ